jgi:peptide/nickel transport system permease protein
MINFIIRRVLIALLVVFLVSVFVFSIMHILPGEPVRLAMGYEAAEEDVQRVREELNLTKPLVEQYFLWIKGLFQGDFGISIVFHRTVAELLKERLPRTVTIGIPAMIIAVIVGVGFGIISALRRGKWLDQVITLIATLGVGTPQFWLGIVGIYIFAIGLKILPMQGYTAPTEDFPMYLKKAVMPIFCMCIVMLASLARQTRSNMLEVINQDYIRTARANGIPEHKVIFRHALKNALIPVITIIGMQVRVIVGGSLLVEQVFSIAGIGTMMTHAISNRDYFVVQSCVLVISLFTVASNLIVDIIYGVIDPRIRESWR